MSWLDICLIVYGVIMLFGGTMGYVKAHSIPSLVTGIVTAILVGVALVWARSNTRMGYGLATLVVIALIAVFIKRSTETDKPAMSYMLAGGSALMLVLLIVGHFLNRNPV